MQTVASKSPLGWALVHKIEETKDFDMEILVMDGEKVRKAEKELITGRIGGAEGSWYEPGWIRQWRRSWYILFQETG